MLICYFRHAISEFFSVIPDMLIYGMGAQNIVSFLQAVLEIPIPPPDDSSLIIPTHTANDIASVPVTMPTYNPTLNTPLPPQIQVPQHHQQQLQQQQQHHQQHPPQQPVLNVPQHKESCRTMAVGSGKGPTANEGDKNGVKCALCKLCPHHSKAYTYPITEAKLLKKSPEKVKLTKDQRDDLKVNTKCTVCKIVFRTREHYRMHKILHPQIRKKQRVKCPSCSAEFPDRSKLKEHSKIHSGMARDKPFKCELCEKSFNKKSQRSKHVKRCHMKENSHVCDICGKRTFTKSELREHVRIHTGERPYQCEVCDRTFRRKDYLTVHMRQHTGVKPYSCEECGESFVQRVSLCKHLQTKHVVGGAGGMEASVPQAVPHQQPSLSHTMTQDSLPPPMSVVHGGLYYP